MTLRRLWRDPRGGVGLLVAGMMPVLVSFTAFAVDIGAINLDSRRLQGIADAAALAGASLPSDAERRAGDVLSGSGFPYKVTLAAVEKGRYSLDPGIPAAQRFAPASTDQDAVRVVLRSTTPTFFARIFGTGEVGIARAAIARRQHDAAFAIGSRLASVNDGLLNAYLGALVGSELKLSALDYNALAAAQVDLFSLLPLLRARAGLSPGTYDEALAMQVALPTVLDALSQSLLDSGQGRAASAVKLIGSVAGGQSVSLGALLDPGPLGKQRSGGATMARVEGLSLLTAVLQLAARQRQVALDLGATLPGLASTRLVVAVGERMRQTPWITITDTGAAIVRTAQARVYLRTALSPVSLPGVATAVSINLPIMLDLASAEGRLAAISCPSTASRSVSLEGRTGLATATIGTVDETQVNNFATTLQPAAARLVDVGLSVGRLAITTNTRIALGEAEQWQKRTFDQREIDYGTRKTIAATAPIGGIAASLIGQAKLSVDIGLLGLFGTSLPIDPLLSAVGAALKPVGAVLDPLLLTVTGMVGVGIGEADLQVTGMRCGQATLVA